MAHYTRPALNTSEFNIREIAKQLILLEDHLTDDEKFCEDCIRKHLLTVEALSEEAVSLDPAGKWVKECKGLAEFSRRLMIDFTDGVAKASLATKIRSTRKHLVSLVYDPRVGTSRAPEYSLGVF